MKDRLKKTFDKVQAEEGLKDGTRKLLHEKIKAYQGKAHFRYRKPAAVMACCGCLLVSVLAYRLYFTPVTSINIEINPSVVLEVNRFDKVVSAKGCNDDGRTLLENVDVIYRNYEDAVKNILADKKIIECLAQDEVMAISVTSDNEKQKQLILEEVKICTKQHENIHCYGGGHDTEEEAEHAGLSVGKYHAYEELRILDPLVTAEEVQHMTMREIHDRIHALSDGVSGNVKNGQVEDLEHDNGAEDDVRNGYRHESEHEHRREHKRQQKKDHE